MRHSLATFIALISIALSSFALNARAADNATLNSVIQGGQKSILEQQIEGSYWNMPSYLGTHYISQYSLILKWFGRTETQLDHAHLKKLLTETQLPDGSWFAIKDGNLASGDLNATIFNYWALKAMGVATDSDMLSRAREFILKKGGIQKSAQFTKVFLALFGNLSWKNIPAIPYILFSDWSPVTQENFAQWIGPHLMPLAYLKKMQVARDLGPEFHVDELWTSHTERPRIAVHIPGRGERSLVRKILKVQQPKGSWGAYTVSTILTNMALEHFTALDRKSDPQVNASARGAMTKGFHFIEWMYFESGSSAYKGVLDDGRYWDTALLGIASLESGADPTRLHATGEYLIRRQGASGGFSFGEDFWYAPDTDDTAEIMLFLLHFPDFKPSVDRAVKWLLTMQNKDGGWGAFAKNNSGNAFLRSMTRDFVDSADLFDESSADVTGHILEALGAVGLNKDNSEAVRRAIAYMKHQQDPATGSWEGRWGVNRTYGTGAAVVGLLKAGENPEAPYIQKALQWCVSKQNLDGGFGETTRSYQLSTEFGRGMSTPSQTAWILLALVEAGKADSEAAQKAADFLVSEFQRDGKWIDRSTVGTGHPGIIYMDYPSYPYAFTLTALARYAKTVTAK